MNPNKARNGVSVLKILSYNVHHAHSLFRKRSVSSEIHELITLYNPDIICLQEVWRSEKWSASRLEELCSEGWAHASFLHNVSFPNGAQGNALISRFPIIEERTFDLSVDGHEPRIALGCCLSLSVTDSKHLWVICVHLGLKRRERLMQWHCLKDKLVDLTSNRAVILAGDWNDWDKRLHALIEADGFSEAFATAHGGLPRTFPSFAPILNLDRIYSRSLAVRSAQINGYGRQGWASDHLAYFASFICD